MPIDFKTATKSYLASRQKEFLHDRSQTIGASLIGRCARYIWAITHLKKEDFPPGTREANGFAARGDDIENTFAVPLIEHAVKNQLPGAELVWAGPGKQTTIEVQAWRLSSTPDGIVTKAPPDALKNYGIGDLLSDCFPIEIKSFDPRIPKDSLPKQVHVDQLNAQMGLLNHHGVYKPKFGIILYVDASNYENQIIVPQLFDRIAFERQITRALAIYKSEGMEVLRPEGAMAGGRECQDCPIRDKCQGYSKHVPSTVKEFERLPKGQQQELMSLVGTIDNIARQKKDLTARENGTKSRIKELLSANGTRKAEGALKDGRTFKLVWNRMPGRKTWDADKVTMFLLSRLEDPENYFKKTRPSETLSIKVTNAEEPEASEESGANNETTLELT